MIVSEPSGERADPATAPPADPTMPPFAPVLAALVEPTARRLAPRLHDLDPAGADAAVRGWADLLAGRVHDLLQEVLAGEFTAWCAVRGPFAGTGPAAETRLLAGFTAHVLTDDPAWLTRRYPEAARLVGVLAGHAAAAAVELHERLASARPQLAAGFGIAADDPLVDLRAGAGDSHRGGRTVVLLTFGSGRRVVAKPRSVRPERVLEALLHAVALAAGDPGWDPVVALDTGNLADAGWMEFVEALPATAPADVDRFFRRAGMLLATAHAIGMDDLHSENVIARRDRPVVIDAETLLPAVCLGRPGAGLDPAAEAYPATVLGTGLLPRWIPVHRQRLERSGHVVQLGGLGPIDLGTQPGLAWTGSGATLRREVVAVRRARGGNLPVLDDRVHTADEAREQVEDGFRAAAAALLRHRNAWESAGGVLAELRATRVRVVPRNTATYAAALRRTTGRRFLRSGAVRTAGLQDRLGLDAAPASAALRTAELDALQQLDVPLFTADPERTAVDTAHGTGAADPGHEPAAVQLTAAPAAVSRNRLEDWDDRHLIRQTELLRATLTAPWTGALPVVAARPGHRTAAEIDGRVADLADVIDGAGVTAAGRTAWLAVRRDPLTSTTAAGPAGCGLLDGGAGIALFLTEAGHALRTERWHDRRDGAITAVLDGTRFLLGPSAPDTGAPIDLGLDDGIGGVVWTLARIARRLDTADGHRLVGAAADLAAAAVVRTDLSRVRADAAGGIAGLITGLTELARTTALAVAADGPTPATGSAADSGIAALVDTLTRALLSRGADGDDRTSRPGSLVDEAGILRALAGAAEVTPGLRDEITAVVAGSATRWGSTPARSAGAVPDLDTARALVTVGHAARALHTAPPGAVASGQPAAPAEHGLRRGVAGWLDLARTTATHHPSGTGSGSAPAPVHDLTAMLLTPVDRLRLIGPQVAPWLVCGLGDGLAGVGLVLLGDSLPDVVGPLLDPAQPPRPRPAGDH
ncbi:DUF4135 domain-containing protein [Nakamurella leprariae]|uniref:DUF4135 domain-containing protein n=1 Tax=Nakamurella leprariae TaxID=2803911 RepID=A0A938YAD6_9ACTN|nr:DUF4135 domain-containing protein [Nakamurella leprariae]MBM9466144.1 DUF4135 domain-containing protein [Nakamurella leprariae]